MRAPTSDSAAPAGALIALLGLSSLITGLDFTIVYVALPHIGTDLAMSSHSLQWVISAYAISFGGLLLLAGRLVDLLGARRVFLAGMFLFTIGSVCGALSSAPEPLLGARAVQGVGAAALFPSTLTLVSTLFAEGRPRDRAFGAWAAAGAVGLSLGALAGGLLTDLTGWQGVFWVNVPMTIACIVAATLLIPGDASASGLRAMDLPGAGTGTIGMTLLVFSIAQGPELGWSSTQVVFSGLAALFLLVGFVVIEAKTAQPLLPWSMFRGSNLKVAALIILLFGMTLNTVPYVLTQYFQSILGFSPLEAGVAFLVPTVTITAGTLLGEGVIARWGVRAVLCSGLLIGGAGSLALSLVLKNEAGLLTATPAIAVFGFGLGIVFPAMFSAAGAGVPEGQAGVASGISSTALQLGSALGLAVMVAVTSASSDRAAGLGAALQDGLLYVAGGALVAALVSRWLPATGRTDNGALSAREAGTASGSSRQVSGLLR